MDLGVHLRLKKDTKYCSDIAKITGIEVEQMTETKLYKCDFCGKEYSMKERAKWCEDSHEKDFEIVNRAYRGMNECADKFPVKIWVRSKNGEERMYRL